MLNQKRDHEPFGSPATIEQVVDGQKGKALDQALKFTDTIVPSARQRGR